MQTKERQGPPRKGLLGLMPLAVAVLLAACAMTEPQRLGEMSCKSAMQPDTTAAYTPGFTCLVYGEPHPAIGARSGTAATPMKAVRVGERIYFIDARRADAPGEAR